MDIEPEKALAGSFRPKSARLVDRYVKVAMMLACVATVTGLMGKWYWLFDLSAHFRVQYAVALLLGMCWATFRRQWRQTSVLLIFCVVNVALIVPIYRSSDRTTTSKNRIRIVSANVWANNQSYDEVLNWIDRERPDIVAFLEVSLEWDVALRTLATEYPHSIVDPDVGNFGVAVYSRIPFDDAKFIYGPVLDKASAIVRMRIDQRPVTLIVTHPIPPKSPFLSAARNQHLDEIANAVLAETNPVILVGDLNNTTWSSWFSDFLSKTGLRDSRQGFGNLASWPSQAPPLAIPIDHCLVSPEFAIVDRRVCPIVGSDHRAVVCDLWWAD